MKQQILLTSRYPITKQPFSYHFSLFLFRGIKMRRKLFLKTFYMLCILFAILRVNSIQVLNEATLYQIKKLSLRDSRKPVSGHNFSKKKKTGIKLTMFCSSLDFKFGCFVFHCNFLPKWFCVSISFEQLLK